MGPRPLRRGAAAIAGERSPVQTPDVLLRPVAPVGAPSPRRLPIVEAMPLPAETRRALSGIVAQLRDVPRAIIGDPAEVVHFLGRTARALERLRDQPVTLAAAPGATSPRPALPTPAPSPLPRTLSPHERAEAVFRASPPLTEGGTSAPPSAGTVLRSTSGAQPRPRIVLDRKGHGVRVEVRRAREAGQIEMFAE